MKSSASPPSVKRARLRVLVDHTRSRLREKRGGGLQKLSLSEAAELSGGRDVEVLDLDGALGHLANVDPRKAKLVELRYFGGLTMEEAADVLGTSLATAERDTVLFCGRFV